MVQRRVRRLKDAKIHVLTHGLHYASAVFEGERADGGRVFKLTEDTGVCTDPLRSSVSKCPTPSTHSTRRPSTS
ncbi:hypothetical protein [Rhizobium leguminosarum]|uniref:Probable branched-chain-amino-acid aminotransferase n=1 Tax=Rhizobium leguminosarum TaxID=384 RepID=A0A2K9Z6G3_RHILE|nr:hypothetical protein [Rhizobium leguminosarum]AUW43681.1 hypothetical protein CUJ84_Chr003343 [Rhizobium leguminosarum]